MDRDNKWFDINFLIEEGEEYKFNEIEIVNNIKNSDTERLEKVLTMKTGERFNADLINSSIDSLTNELAKEGFAFVNIRTGTKENEELKQMDLTFIIDETPRIYVGDIKILGNTRTYDYIIRREMRLEEGDPFSISKFERSLQRIRNLGYFEFVDMQRVRGDSPNKLDIIIKVQEKKTGEFQFGVGYSTSDGANANIGIRENNLLGMGQTMDLSILYAKYTKDISLSYGKPYFMGRDLYAGFNIFYRDDEDEESVDYKESTYGVGFNTNYAITEYMTQSLNYSLYKQEIKDVGIDYQGVIGEQETITSSIGQTIYYDKRDSRINPTKGYSLSWNLTYAGIGGDKKYIKSYGNAALYIPVWPSVVTLKLGARGGIIEGMNGEPVDPTDAFYLGGSSLKGFAYGGVGPRVINSSTGSAIDGSSVGGKQYYVVDAELKFPLGLPEELGVSGGLFINAGTLTGVDASSTLDKSRVVDSGSLRSAYGLSISWNSPMGPLTFDFSKTLREEVYDESENFAFNFGSNF